jgi:pyruvate,water dikinase
MKDIYLVGGKNASLGGMLQNFTKLGVNIPGGFVITVNAYQEFIQHNNLDEKIRSLVKQIDFSSVESLRRAGLQIRNVIRNGRFPSALSQEIINCYYELSKKYDRDETDVAVRSSAAAEDLPDASFAGQQETYLNVRDPAALMDSVRNCFALSILAQMT